MDRATGRRSARGDFENQPETRRHARVGAELMGATADAKHEGTREGPDQYEDTSTTTVHGTWDPGGRSARIDLDWDPGGAGMMGDTGDGTTNRGAGEVDGTMGRPAGSDPKDSWDPGGIVVSSTPTSTVVGEDPPQYGSLV